MRLFFIKTLVLLLTSLYASAQGSWGLDNSFRGTGKFTTSLPYFGMKSGAAVSVIQPDGKILVGGKVYDNFHPILMRYNPDGTLDSTFGTYGIMEISSSWYNISVTALALQPDGKILLAANFLLLRYNPDGSSDMSFGTNGEVITNVNPGLYENNVVSIILQPDGKIVLGGNAYLFTNILRYNVDGTPDTTFGTGGAKTIQLHWGYWSSVAWLALQPDGKIIGAGYSPDSMLDFNLALARFNTDGSEDTGFGTNGYAIIDAGSNTEFITDVLVLPDGKILGGGWGMDNANYENCLLVRCLPNGAPDSSFGTNGLVHKSWSNEGDLIKSLALQPDGKIIATGDYYTGATLSATDHDFFVSRFEPTGNIDSSFGNSGIISTDFGNKYDIAYDVSLQADGKIVIVGESGENPFFALARYALVSPSEVSPNEAKALQHVEVYPNPFEDLITVKGLNVHDRVDLMDITGRVVYRWQSSSTTETFTISDLVSGYYVLSVVDEHGIGRMNMPMVKR